MSYISTKSYIQEFPVAYRQWRADRKSGKDKNAQYTASEIPGCCAIHGYALSIYIEFSTEHLDSRMWCVDFGSLRPLKEFLKENFDHTLLVAQDDPYFDVLENLHKLGLAKMVVVEATGCEALSKFLYDYINEIFIPDHYPNRDVQCIKVEVRETPSNSAWFSPEK